MVVKTVDTVGLIGAGFTVFPASPASIAQPCLTHSVTNALVPDDTTGLDVTCRVRFRGSIGFGSEIIRGLQEANADIFCLVYFLSAAVFFHLLSFVFHIPQWCFCLAHRARVRQCVPK